MPFDPNLPQPHLPLDADVVRAQLNALNDKIDAQTLTIDAQAATIGSLTARIAALENPVPAGLVAIGFGEAGACGLLTVIGTFAGKPMYQAAGGWWYCWNDSGGMWICRNALPGTGDMSNNRYADQQYAADITAVMWGPGFNPGMMPYGTVS